MTAKLTEEQIKQLPKADLHVHLDGSIRIPTLIELAKEQGVKLPTETIEGLREQVFKDRYKDLPDYLTGFGLICSVLQDKESIERVAYEFAWDCFNEGVIYVEPRYSPELFQGEGKSLSIEDGILAVDKGLKKAQSEINAQLENDKSTALIRFNYSHIICAMRQWDASRSLNLVMEAVKVRDKHGLQIGALDLAGPEAGFPAIDHRDAYTYAHQHFMYKTVHAGEAFGPSSIFQALTELHADRIGHGFHLFTHSKINTDNEEKAKKYVQDLVHYVAERRITLEVCLTSNLQTMPELDFDIKKHTFKKMIQHGISAALCTDNRTVSNTTVTKELMLAQDAFDMSIKQMKKFIMYPIKRSFYPGDYLVKKKFIDQCSKYYDLKMEEFGLKELVKK